MRHSIHKPLVWCGVYRCRIWIYNVRSMASEPTKKNSASNFKKRTRWKPHETMILIDAKKKQDMELEKTGGETNLKTAGEKWKEVEVFCQEKGVDRTAQQCRDKWERIVPAYLKIKDWERSSGKSSYWLMKPTDRKKEGFQHALDPETFDALDKQYNQERPVDVTTTRIHSSNDQRDDSPIHCMLSVTRTESSTPMAISHESTTPNTCFPAGHSREIASRTQGINVLQDGDESFTECMEKAEDSHSEQHKDMLTFSTVQSKINVSLGNRIKSVKEAIAKLLKL